MLARQQINFCDVGELGRPRYIEVIYFESVFYFKVY